MDNYQFPPSLPLCSMDLLALLAPGNSSFTASLSPGFFLPLIFAILEQFLSCSATDTWD